MQKFSFEKFTQKMPGVNLEFKAKKKPDDLCGDEKKIYIPFNIIDIPTRLQVLLGLKLSGHNDTLTEVSNLIDEL